MFLVKYYVTKAYGVAEAKIHPFITSEPNEGKWSASRLSRFIPGWPNFTPETPWNKVVLHKLKLAVWTCKLFPNFTKTR